MATQTKVELIDDLTGDKADETVLFGIDGRGIVNLLGLFGVMGMV